MSGLFTRLKKITMCLCAISLSFAAYSLAYAKPDLKPLGLNIADHGSSYYQFQVHSFQSADQQRHYKVWLGIPKQINKNQPRPAIFMLDGNSVMARLDEALLKQLSEQDSPVLVAIGYQTQLPFESASRSVDYTPADESGKISADPRNPERMSGGSPQFRQMIFEKIMPWIYSQVKLDAQRTALWGHSYGGLFVLDTLLNRQQHEQKFSHYFAASPSLTWADSRLLKAVEQVKPESVKDQKLLVMEGDLIPSSTAKISPHADRDMNQNNRKLVLDLASKGANTKLLLYPHLSHGEVFQASLMDILQNRLF
ncbi:alpha/beta hydrolase [Acinetobacter bereziniae]|uniref:alpha/beta hydrolase n=1 Tax=Acinetobacter bereziniae TaxID=106648 RepID=UPI0012504019|nr:alpha/beta hydrolase [Acinetobacter bereziniae]MCU4538579.1 alpha/beta hydrolase [Acinetobacter bereziniae]NUF62880.1 alpha/beta hydrolase [Acinetobacter bereziniae]NUG06546.1 alpha/beta hydrolase [Acinetobacter bereziniae]NUG63957.1 alpha/beta hydrolase [Acinetobacter bereziniae]NUG69303.1 alpha/beta hydrolase [Acinetobacter bereziniae]